MFLTSNHPVLQPLGLQQGMVQRGLCRAPIDTCVRPAFLFRRSLSLYVCLLPQALSTAPRSGQRIFCVPAYPPEIMVHIRMGVYAANVDALLIHHCT